MRIIIAGVAVSGDIDEFDTGGGAPWLASVTLVAANFEGLSTFMASSRISGIGAGAPIDTEPAAASVFESRPRSHATVAKAVIQKIVSRIVMFD
ncbi:MAG: hypothetical protein H0W69_11425 [Gemmatimonadaceae bacterium]|nr:hypothetical protein [Gemmatimonadaceae bacterium]